MKKFAFAPVLVAAFALATTTMAHDGDHQHSPHGKGLSERDRIRAAVQQICPVTGDKLGSHGAPIKAKIGQEEIFLCCQGCLKGKVNPKYWATIHDKFAKAQGICPVMKNTVSSKSKWTVVKGQIIYVCCPPCAKKIQADPDKYLKAVTDAYAAWLKKKTVR